MMKKKITPTDLMTLEEVAEYLRLSIHTLYKMAQAGRIPAMKAGAVWRFRKADLDVWMKQGAEKEIRERKTAQRRKGRR